MVSLIERHVGDSLRVVPSFYGMHLAAIARDAIDCDAVSERLARDGIMVHSLSRYFLEARTHNGFILGYAAADLDALRITVRALGKEIG